MASHAASILQPRVGAGVLLVDEHERVLLTLRKAAPEAGCWSILGGKVDFLETVKDCAIREAYEEAGVRVAIERLLCITDHLLPAENQHWVSPSYLARIVEGDVYNREPHKSEVVQWFGLDELPENLTMTARNAIAAYRGSTSAPSTK
ncbi:MAG: NUDIX domain-containing protein [Acidobacteria bacterium]|nr:NUDIX domain-containing protein [Acidobacteriota bacterium]